MMQSVDYYENREWTRMNAKVFLFMFIRVHSWL